MKFDKGKLIQECALKFRHLREGLGYNRTEMGEWLGVTRAAYNKYEDGETFPFVQTLVRLGQAKNISLDWFASYASSQPRRDAKEHEGKILRGELFLRFSPQRATRNPKRAYYA